jgi:hypothetical protein
MRSKSSKPRIHRLVAVTTGQPVEPELTVRREEGEHLPGPQELSVEDHAVPAFPDDPKC